jgi:hypothetical protein
MTDHLQRSNSRFSSPLQSAESLPKTAWILAHTHAGRTWQNVNLAETRAFPGDELVWRLYKIGTQPTPEVRVEEPTGDEPAPAIDAEDDL